MDTYKAKIIGKVLKTMFFLYCFSINYEVNIVRFSIIISKHDFLSLSHLYIYKSKITQIEKISHSIQVSLYKCYKVITKRSYNLDLNTIECVYCK